MIYFRHMKEMAPGTRERISKRTGTEVGYARKTWSNEQIVCDSFQNHLDAETRAFIRILSKRYIADSDEQLETRVREDPELKEQLSSVRYGLYLLAIRGGDLSPKRRAAQFVALRALANVAGVTLSSSCTAEAFATNERPRLPEVRYAVRDMHAKGLDRVFSGLTREAVLAAFPDSERYRVVEVRISDSGSGYLPHKTELYLPSKDEPWDRGVWGEGSKVNNANTVRDPNAFVVSESTTKRKDGALERWRRRMYSSGDKKHAQVLQRGFNETIEEGSTGSSTIYRFAVDAGPGVREAFDPRRTPLGSIVGEYEKKFLYPTLDIAGNRIPPGVSLELGAQQYLQGLRIGTGKEGFLFSYDFSQKEGLLSGRDRKHIDFTAATSLIMHFWMEVEQPELIAELVRRVFAQSSASVPEYAACKAKLYSPSRWASAIPRALGFSRTKKNLLVPSGHQLSPETIRDVHIVPIAPLIDQDLMVGLAKAIRNACPEYDVAYISEIENPTESATERPWDEHESRLFEKMDKAIELESGYFAPFARRFPYLELPKVGYKRSAHISYPQFDVTRKNERATITFLLPEKDSVILDSINPHDLARRLFMARLASLGAKGYGLVTAESNQMWRLAVQTAAQMMLNDASTSSDIRTIPHSLYSDVRTLVDEQGFKSFTPEKIDEISFELLMMTRQCRDARCTPGELFRIAETGASDDKYRDLMHETIPRIICDEGRCSFQTFEKAEDGRITPALHTVDLAGLPLAGTWGEHEVRQLPDGRLVIAVPTPTHTVLRHEYRNAKGGLSISQEISLDDDIVFEDGTIIKSSMAGQDMRTGFQRYPRLDRGCIIASTMDDLQGWEFIAPNPERSRDEAPVQQGLMPSPLTLEYINDIWDDPRRVFQDLRQNHDDASKDPARERFLVRDGWIERWVTASELGDHEILGYELSDTGPGYLPNGIQNMGHSEKRNPMLTGKNGEGLKLAAASALKAGFALEFSSIGSNGIEEVAWTAEAATIQVADETEGKERMVSQLAFDVRTGGKAELDGVGARTRIRLPNSAGHSVAETWAHWVQTIDPRNKNSRGEGGLDRYVISDAHLGDHTSVGAVTLLFDRPGEVYENRNFIRSEPQDSMHIRLGWNFPSVTDTRERDRYDPLAVAGHVRYFFENTQSERAVRLLLENLVERDQKRVPGEATSSTRIRSELSPEIALINIRFAPSLPLFRKQARALFPGMILYCGDLIGMMSDSERGNVGHIPLRNRLSVTKAEYEFLRHIFPNMHQYASHLADVTVRLSERELAPIRNEVCARVRHVEERLARMRDDPATGQLYQSLIARTGVSESELFARARDITPDRIAGTPRDVFVGPDDSRWAGLATGAGAIGINSDLLSLLRRDSLSSTIDHEIAHVLTRAPDYSEEFASLLALLALSKSLGTAPKA